MRRLPIIAALLAAAALAGAGVAGAHPEPHDRDHDGLLNFEDNCPDYYNPLQTDTDGDGAGDVCDADDDADGIADGQDNCPEHANVKQEDADGDEVGDACDPRNEVPAPKPSRAQLPPPDPADRRAPRIELKVVEASRADGMTVAVRCSEACAIDLRVRRGSRQVGRGKGLISGPAETFVSFRVKARGRLGLSATVRDASGNRARATRRVRVR